MTTLKLKFHKNIWKSLFPDDFIVKTTVLHVSLPAVALYVYDCEVRRMCFLVCFLGPVWKNSKLNEAAAIAAQTFQEKISYITRIWIENFVFSTAASCNLEFSHTSPE